MKTQPMSHQLDGQARLDEHPEYYALGAEQGTGKTWMLLNDIERQFNAGRIDAVLVIAPKGVHVNWVRREIPTHMSVPVRAEYWAAGAGARHMAKITKLLRPDFDGKLTVLSMNIDALNTKKGAETAKAFLTLHKAMMIIDESQRIKNPTAGRTKKALVLGKDAVSRRIASGTMMGNGPQDLFSQYEFLHPGLLGTKSFRAFVAEFCELLPDHHPIVQQAMAKSRGPAPQIIARDERGRPKYKNMERLTALLAPHTYRVLKADCLDLPEKIYQTVFFELEPSQRKVYKEVDEEMRFTLGSDVSMFDALSKLTKLRQVTSGFLMVDGAAIRLDDDAARMKAFKDAIEDIEGQFIVWAVYREEIQQIAALMDKLGITAATYYGDTTDHEREAAVDGFQKGDIRCFIGNASAGGTGLTLTAANTVIYYSNDYSLEKRMQSEDRAHRIGTKNNVVYIDLVATDTIDEKVAAALQSKREVFDAVFENI